jgi:hypothetical protein
MGCPSMCHKIVVRNLLRPVDMLPAFYLLGGAGGDGVRSTASGLGDLAANTVVVRTRQCGDRRTGRSC